LALIVMPFFILYCVLTGKHIASLKQRLGLLTPEQFTWQHPIRIWLHAASVGEVQAARALISELNKTDIHADLILSTVTEQGRIVAEQQLGNQVTCLYAPIDLPWIVNRFIMAIKPSLYICLETELWPNMLRMLKLAGIKTLLLNGRMSERSFGHYRLISSFMTQVMSSLTAAATISTSDMEKYADLGLAREKIIVCGNAKYDLGISSSLTPNEDAPRDNLLNARQTTESHKLNIEPGQPVLVAGSTHSGEEESLIMVHQALRNELPDLIMVIAPRHLDRLGAIEAFLKKEKINFQKLSELDGTNRTAAIILVDYMGELTRLYAAATYAFCGGSLVDRGGHNIMEPAIWGIPPFYGPYMKDFADAAQIFKANGAGFSVNSAQDLINKIIYFNKHKVEYSQAGQAAKDIAQSQQGAARKQVRLIAKLLATANNQTNRKDNESTCCS